MKTVVTGLLCVAIFVIVGPARAEDKKVCVEVLKRAHGGDAAEAKPWSKGATPAAPQAATPEEVVREPASPALPGLRIQPLDLRGRGWPYPPEPYLKRLIEHYVTHERGFVAVAEDCSEHLRVELYPLDEGWTVFARYTGSQREEKVDQVRYEELSRLASRIALSLLYDRPIHNTVRRDNVLDADSNFDVEKIRGSNHFVAELGTTIRLPIGGIATAPDDPSRPARSRIRLLSSVEAAIGYRGSFRAWGLDVRFGMGGNASQRAGQRSNPLGGHVDPTVSISTGLSFFWYLAPEAVNSLYAGLGTRLDLNFFNAVKPRQRDFSLDDDSPMIGAGLSAVGLVGYEMLRTNSVRPFVEASLILPAYVVDSENDFGAVDSWMPGFGLKFGAMF